MVRPLPWVCRHQGGVGAFTNSLPRDNLWADTKGDSQMPPITIEIPAEHAKTLRARAAEDGVGLSEEALRLFSIGASLSEGLSREEIEGLLSDIRRKSEIRRFEAESAEGNAKRFEEAVESPAFKDAAAKRVAAAKSVPRR